jgi:hypothetical protein
VNKGSVLFLQAIIVLIGIGALTFMMWEPHVEGRNAHATLFQIYFNDPFLAYAYMGSIPFFVGLYQASNVVGFAGQGKLFSEEAMKALRTIKYCAIVILGFVVDGEIFIIMNTSDDRAGGVFMGLLVAAGSIAVATAASTLERNLKNKI